MTIIRSIILLQGHELDKCLEVVIIVGGFLIYSQLFSPVLLHDAKKQIASLVDAKVDKYSENRLWIARGFPYFLHDFIYYEREREKREDIELSKEIQL